MVLGVIETFGGGVSRNDQPKEVKTAKVSNDLDLAATSSLEAADRNSEIHLHTTMQSCPCPARIGKY